jgi:hypothetical protein
VPVETARPLTERSLEEWLWTVLAERAEGSVVVRDREGLRHGVWVQGGFVVGIHVAGRFDPLLDLLRRDGTLSSHAYASCVRALNRPGQRCGAVAMEIAGIERAVVRGALRRQIQERMAALLELSAERGHDACFEPGPVPLSEMSVRMPLGALLRSVAGAPREAAGGGPAGAREPTAQKFGPPGPASGQDVAAEARRRLRALARQLHPDLNAHLPPERRRRLERALAEATAAYHGLARGARAS